MAEWVAAHETFKFGTRWWYRAGRLDYYIDSDYTVRVWGIPYASGYDVIAGPFETLEAAKAALVMLSGVV